MEGTRYEKANCSNKYIDFVFAGLLCIVARYAF